MQSTNVANSTMHDATREAGGPAAASPVPSDVWDRMDLPTGGEARLAALAKDLSKAGKLPGYRAGAGADLFAFHGFGEPWDYEVRAIAAGERVEFRPRILRKAPLLFAIICVLSIWPGAWLTDSMLKAYFSGYSWNTYLWYLPLTILPIPPVAWRMWTRSKRAAYEHVREKVAMLREAVG
jgi:hypothetical protein